VTRTRSVRAAVGVVVILATFTYLWIEFGPRSGGTEDPPPPTLVASRAAVEVQRPGRPPTTATITCDGPLRTATGFWADDPVEACDALASTGPALVAGPGCRAADAGLLRLRATGTFEGEDFAHRQQRGGCPDPDGWLAVNALVAPVAAPEQKLTESSEPPPAERP
jgi:hypothetical protein